MLASLSPRPVPADFAEMAKVMTRKKLREHYACGQQTVARWSGLTGIVPLSPPKTNNPNGKPAKMFPDWEKYAAIESSEQLQKRYGVCRSTIAARRSETGIRFDLSNAKKASVTLRPVPDDWAAVAPTMHGRALAVHYVASRNTVRRWAAESGIPCLKYIPPKKDRDATQDVAAYQATKNSRGIDLRQRTNYDIAADCLRTDKWKIFRCDKNGSANFSGSFWRVGAKQPMNSEQMLFFALDRSKTIRRPEYDWLRGDQDYDGWRGVNGWDEAA